ncbi:hemolysin family protein [Planctomyces sp. SH-PL62]|uniref:hemolysin family protein n=1 Tax=Planctomyces sp. SH-PL62 TaxID=1636152 RepID=UPI00078BB9DB|nr:hemolysin family protein [Planctomyces sp. SH-PL62]AMV36235.1 Magnesium and cobalt efflux protein CorC [Planctomyces sp. SH-PL62]
MLLEARRFVEIILIEIGVVVLLILANGLFSMAELAIVSSRKARLRQAAEAGDGRAAVALELANDPNRFLSTVQVGITVVGTLAGVFGGATIAVHLGDALAKVPALVPYAESLGLAAVVAAVSYLTLVFGELTPKRLALSNPEGIASWAAGPLRLVSIATVPLVRLLGWSTDRVLRLLGVHETGGSPVTEEEIQVLVREGAEVGAIETAEHDMVRRVFRLNDQPARVLMTQRADVAWIDADGTPEEVRRRVLESSHAGFPVGEGSLDKVVGIVQAKDLLGRSFEDGPLDVRSLMRPALFVFEGASGLKVLEQFKAAATPMAIVVDEYGSVEGLLTLNDILQALVGDLAVEEGYDASAVRRDDGSWLLDGTLSIHEVSDLPGLPRLPEGEYGTLAGFILVSLGHIPDVGDHFEWEGHKFEVVDMDENRIDRVLVTGPESRPPAESDPESTP